MSPSIASQDRRAPIDLPRWTKRVFLQASGRDPLGLSGVSHLIADWLIKGVTTQTPRARYYSLYAWSIDDARREVGDSDLGDFLNGLQRREAAVACATLLEGRSVPRGVRTVRPKLDSAKANKMLDSQFSVLPSNRAGGYGQYYSGPMYALGLTSRGEQGVDVVEAGIGQDLVEAVQSCLRATKYVKDRWPQKRRVPLSVLTAAKRRLSLDGLHQPFCIRERQLLRDLLLGGATPTSPMSPYTLFRRKSILRLLDLLSAYEKAGKPVTYHRAELQVVFAPAYYSRLVVAGARNRAYSCPPGLRDVDALWRQFSLHGYVTLALETLLRCLLDVLALVPRGLTVKEIVDRLVGASFVGFLRDRLGKGAGKPSGLFASLGLSGVPTEADVARFRKTYGLEHELGEQKLRRALDDGTSVGAAAACLLLAVVYGKWRSARDPELKTVADSAGGYWHTAGLLPLLDAWFSSDLSWPVAMQDIVSTILIHHDEVMYSKGRLESCWVHAEDGRYVYDQACSPYLRGSRHPQLLTILEDLGFVETDESAELQLTDEGRGVLAACHGEMQ